MDAKTLNRARKMDVTSLEAKLEAGGFTAIERPYIESLIAEKKGSAEQVEVAEKTEEKTEKTSSAPVKARTIFQQMQAKAAITGAIVAKTQNIKPEEPKEATTKHKPNETTCTIEAFSDDTKGIRKDDTVTFPSSTKAGSILMEGKVQRIFKFLRETREEAKIKGTDGKRYYRREKDINKVATVSEAKSEEASIPEAAE